MCIRDRLYLYAANNFKAGTISVITYDKTTETLTCADLYNPVSYTHLIQAG